MLVNMYNPAAKRILSIALTLLLLAAYASAASRPNVVLIAVDDMNDWTGPLASTMVDTPNLDRLADKGVTFQNAHTAGIYCAPSRSAIFTGRYATTTGCYRDQLYFYDHPEYRPLQVAFKQAGYETYGTGKLFHHPPGHLDQRGWDTFFVRTEEQKANGWPMDSWEHGAPLPDPYPHSPFNQADEKWRGRPFMEVGPIPDDQEENMADTIRTNWACNVLKQEHDTPVFVALGLYAPHYPNYAPQKYFDMNPLDSIRRPEWKDDDLDDIPEIMAKRHIPRKANIHDKLVEMGIVDSTIQGYLACIAYADAMVGRVLDAIEAGPNRDNTIVVFWSDHGYAHGQKGHWGKHTLWERTSNVPFLWAGPGIAPGASIDATASLIDIFPTLVELCGLDADTGLDGTSLAATLAAPETAQDRSVLLPNDVPESYAIINRDWRYIRYSDGSQELYNEREDPHEWYNLADNGDYAPVMRRLEKLAPTSFAAPGTSKSNLQMETDGETFRWVPKPSRETRNSRRNQ